MDWRGIVEGIVIAVAATPVIWLSVKIGRRLIDLTGLVPAVLVITRNEVKGGIPGEGLGRLNYGKLSLAIYTTKAESAEVYAKSFMPGESDIIGLRPGNYRFELTWHRLVGKPVQAVGPRYLTFGRQAVTIGLVPDPLGNDAVLLYRRPPALAVMLGDGTEQATLTIGQFGLPARGRRWRGHAQWTLAPD